MNLRQVNAEWEAIGRERLALYQLVGATRKRGIAVLVERINTFSDGLGPSGPITSLIRGKTRQMIAAIESDGEITQLRSRIA